LFTAEAQRAQRDGFFSFAVERTAKENHSAAKLEEKIHFRPWV
jgi:hypothetical protein